MDSTVKGSRGFVPVMLTPFLSDGSVDYDALTRLTERYVEAGSSGLFANCLSSEMFDLTPSERLQVIRHVVKAVKGRIPVVASGTFETGTAAQSEFVKAVHGEGAEAVIILTNMLAGKEEGVEVFQRNFDALLERTPGIPLGFYECPSPYKRLADPVQLAGMVATGRVIYHKDTCCDIGQIREKLKAVGNGHPKFGLYDAFMGHAVDTLRAGSAGLSCIQGNYWPELIAWLCRYFDDPERQAGVEKVQEFLTKTMDIAHQAYPRSAKHFLNRRGLAMNTRTRQSKEPLTQKQADDLELLHNVTNMLYRELSIAIP